MDIVEMIRYIIYGLLQGFMEVLPLSSSGVVSFVTHVARDEFLNNEAFLVVVNLGSLVAIIIYFRETIIKLFKHSYAHVIKREVNEENIKTIEFIKNIIIAIIPIIIVGFIYTVYGAGLEEYTLIIVGIGALLTGTILYSSRNTTDRYTKTIVNRKQAWYIGLFQILAVLPGVSRLGVTTAAGTHKELSFETSLTFSLLIYIPVSIGTIFFLIVSGVVDFSVLNSDGYIYIYYLISMIVSFFATFLALKYIFIITRRGNFKIFYIFNILFGIAALTIGIINY